MLVCWLCGYRMRKLNISVEILTRRLLIKKSKQFLWLWELWMTYLAIFLWQNVEISSLHSSDALLWRCHDVIFKPFFVSWLSPHPEVSWKSVAKSDGQAWLATTDLCSHHFPFLFSSSFTFSFIPSLSLVAFTFPTPLSVMTHCSCHCHDNRFGCSHGLWSVFTWLLVSAFWIPGCAGVIHVAIVSVNS